MSLRGPGETGLYVSGHTVNLGVSEVIQEHRSGIQWILMEAPGGLHGGGDIWPVVLDTSRRSPGGPSREHWGHQAWVFCCACNALLVGIGIALEEDSLRECVALQLGVPSTNSPLSPCLPALTSPHCFPSALFLDGWGVCCVHPK